MGMSIRIGRLPMSRPPGMTDATGAVSRLVHEEGFQIVETTTPFPHLDGVRSVQNSNTRGIVAAIFEPAQPLDQNRSSRCLSYIPDNTTHNFYKL